MSLPSNTTPPRSRGWLPRAGHPRIECHRQVVWLSWLVFALLGVTLAALASSDAPFGVDPVPSGGGLPGWLLPCSLGIYLVLRAAGSLQRRTTVDPDAAQLRFDLTFLGRRLPGTRTSSRDLRELSGVQVEEGWARTAWFGDEGPGGHATPRRSWRVCLLDRGGARLPVSDFQEDPGSTVRLARSVASALGRKVHLPSSLRGVR